MMSYKKQTLDASSCKSPKENNKIVSISSAKSKSNLSEHSKKEAITKCISYAQTLDW